MIRIIEIAAFRVATGIALICALLIGYILRRTNHYFDLLKPGDAAFAAERLFCLGYIFNDMSADELMCACCGEIETRPTVAT